MQITLFWQQVVHSRPRRNNHWHLRFCHTVAPRLVSWRRRQWCESFVIIDTDNNNVIPQCIHSCVQQQKVWPEWIWPSVKGPGYQDRNVPCCYFAPAFPILLCLVSVKCWDSSNQGLWSDDVTSKFTRQSPSWGAVSCPADQVPWLLFGN